METVKFSSSGEEWTVRFGQRLGALAQPGDWLGLAGELGAGKTRLVQGVALGLGVDPAIPVTSPTFVLLQSYAGRLSLYHLDLYRLRSYEDLVEIGYPELLEGSGVCVVEWWDRVEESRGERGLAIEFSILDERRRELALHPIGRRGRELLDALAQTLTAGGER